jgi:hypothetical protein
MERDPIARNQVTCDVISEIIANVGHFEKVDQDEWLEEILGAKKTQTSMFCGRVSVLQVSLLDCLHGFRSTFDFRGTRVTSKRNVGLAGING